MLSERTPLFTFDLRGVLTALRTLFINFCYICGLRYNFPSMELHISSPKSHLLFLTETQVSGASDSILYYVPSYYLYPDFQSKAGCCVYVRNDITCSRAHDLSKQILVSGTPAPECVSRGAERLGDSTVSRTEATSPPPSPTRSELLVLHNYTSSLEAKQHFLKVYPDLLVTKEDLKPTPLKAVAGPPMKIHLHDDAESFAIHTPRLILSPSGKPS